MKFYGPLSGTSDVHAKAFYGDGSNLTGLVVSPFASGTIMSFYQNSAPTGWTKKTDLQDGAMITYTTGNAGGGGSSSATSIALANHTALAMNNHTALTVNAHSNHTALALNTESTHTHTGPSHNHQWLDVKAGDDTTYDTDGAAQTLTNGSNSDRGILSQPEAAGKLIVDCYTSNAGTGATGAGSAHGHTFSQNIDAHSAHVFGQNIDVHSFSQNIDAHTAYTPYFIKMILATKD